LDPYFCQNQDNHILPHCKSGDFPDVSLLENQIRSKWPAQGCIMGEESVQRQWGVLPTEKTAGTDFSVPAFY
jgi:hypothetical protein